MYKRQEIGHALVAAKQTDSAPVQKITIIPRTSGALGYTMQVDEGEHFLMTKSELLNKITTFTGGRAAEELVFKEVTTGASNDIEPVSYTHLDVYKRQGFSLFRIRLTERLEEKENILAIAVDNSESQDTYPQFADFTLSLIHI